jgi:GGDEF domain-containing protein
MAGGETSGSWRERVQRSWLGVVGPRGWRAVAGPAAFAIFAISLLVYDHLHQRVPPTVFWLALALIIAVFARMVETVRTQSTELLHERHSTLPDKVAGLNDRDQLEADVSAVLALPGEHRVLVLLELDGFRAYNDRFGYAAGDDLLRRYAESLVQAVTPLGGGGYWIEATRFAALVPAGERQLGEVVLAATASLRDVEQDQIVSSAYGEVFLPDDAEETGLAFQIAAQRLSSQKQRQHRSARRQAHAVLMAALLARRPEISEQLRTSAAQAISLGRRLGADSEEIDDIALAADLQNIGMLALPDGAASREADPQPGGAAPSRSMAVAGARIIAAAPGLAEVANLVRSSSEHFDGGGYPDGKTGEEIPLGSRIIAVSGAFAAMRRSETERAVGGEEALAELRRRAGRQFDPRVIEALAADLADDAKASSASAPSQVVS